MVSPNSAGEFGFRGGALLLCFALAVARLVRVANDILAIGVSIGRQIAILFAKILQFFIPAYQS